jgi:four helix bundle protein
MDNIQRREEFLKRLELFSDNINNLCKKILINRINGEIVSQLVRSSGSPGANYIEAIESLSKKDFYFRIRICRKESRESGFWLRRLAQITPELSEECQKLEDEARQFVLIFSKIVALDK